MLQRLLSPHADRAYALLGIVSGAMFAFHGVRKILHLFTEHTPPVGSQVWFGGIIELTCGTAIAVGLLTSWAPFLCSGQMVVAYFQFHWKFQMGDKFFPGVNGGELAVAYCFLYLFIACKGSGPWSLDTLLRRPAAR